MEYSVSINNGVVSAATVNDNIRVLENNINSTIKTLNGYSGVLSNYKDTLLTDSMNRLQYINRVLDSIEGAAGDNSLIKRYLFDTESEIILNNMEINNNKLKSSYTTLTSIPLNDISTHPVVNTSYLDGGYSTNVVLTFTSSTTLNTISFNASSLAPFTISAIKDAADNDLFFIDVDKKIYGRCDIIFTKDITTTSITLTLNTTYAKVTNLDDVSKLSFFDIAKLPTVSNETDLFNKYIYIFNLTDIIISNRLYSNNSSFSLSPFNFESMHFSIDDNLNTEYSANIKFYNFSGDLMSSYTKLGVPILPNTTSKSIVEKCNYDSNAFIVSLRFIPDPSESVSIYNGDTLVQTVSFVNIINKRIEIELISYNDNYTVHYTPLLRLSGAAFPVNGTGSLYLEEEIDQSVISNDPAVSLGRIRFITKYPIDDFTIIQERDGATVTAIDYTNTDNYTVNGRQLFLAIGDALTGVDLSIRYNSPYLNVIDNDSLIFYNDKGGLFINKQSSKWTQINRAEITIIGRNKVVGNNQYASIDDLIIYYSE